MGPLPPWPALWQGPPSARLRPRPRNSWPFPALKGTPPWFKTGIDVVSAVVYFTSFSRIRNSPAFKLYKKHSKFTCQAEFLKIPRVPTFSHIYRLIPASLLQSPHLRRLLVTRQVQLSTEPERSADQRGRGAVGSLAPGYNGGKWVCVYIYDGYMMGIPWIYNGVHPIRSW